MEDVVIKKESAFVGQGYEQHVGVGRKGGATLWNHTYVKPKGADLNGAVAIAHCESPSRIS